VAKIIPIVVVLVLTHLAALICGSWLRDRFDDRTVTGHLSNIGDLIRLGEHFTVRELSGDEVLAAKATRAMIYRVLLSRGPGPNSTKKLEELEAKLRAQSASSEAEESAAVTTALAR